MLYDYNFMDYLTLPTEWTLGSIMFYGGLAGFAITVLIMLITWIIMAAGKKRIIKTLNNEYGGIHIK